MAETPVRSGSGRFRVRDGAGRALRIARAAMGLSQAELGVMMGHAIRPGQSIVSKLEAGHGSVEQYMNAAAALGLSLEAVIEYVRYEPSS